MLKRRRIIAGNWKMYKTAQEAQEYATEFLEALGEIKDLEVVICAPYTALATLKMEFEESIVHIGGQNMFWAEEGAYTGEISAAMLLDSACTYVILGHSERREIMKETDEMIAEKVKTALAVGLAPILCVGEDLIQREQGGARDFVRMQIEKGLTGFAKEEMKRIVIAYEPIWAIGTGKTASSEDAQEMCAAIRSTLTKMAGSIADEIPILYGGSVKTDNVAELMSQADIDGALVGGASLKAREFAELVRRARTNL